MIPSSPQSVLHTGPSTTFVRAVLLFKTRLLRFGISRRSSPASSSGFGDFIAVDHCTSHHLTRRLCLAQIDMPQKTFSRFLAVNRHLIFSDPAGESPQGAFKLRRLEPACTAIHNPVAARRKKPISVLRDPPTGNCAYLR